MHGKSIVHSAVFAMLDANLSKKGMMEMKKAISLLSVILAVILLFSACRSGGNTGGSGTMGNLREEETTQSKALHQSEVPQGFIGIYTVEDLINSGANVGGNYILMNDLDLSSVEDWEILKILQFLTEIIIQFQICTQHRADCLVKQGL